MQVLQGNANPAASGKWGPAPHCRQHGGAHPEGKIIPIGHPVPCARLGLMPVFLATGTCHHARAGWVTPCTPFSPRGELPNLSKLLCLPFLALVGRGGEVPLLQRTPEDRAWQRNPPRNPIYLLLPPHTTFSQTPRGFTRFQLRISS